MRKEDIRRWLKEFKEEDIYYSKHVKEDKFETRKVKENDVKRCLLGPDNLILFEEQESLNPKESKYKLHFRISKSKDLGIVILINKKIKVITAYMIERKWQEKMLWVTWSEK